MFRENLSIAAYGDDGSAKIPLENIHMKIVIMIVICDLLSIFHYL